ncbi:MAG: hypothetical protein WA812_03790 [Candidatus Cybelea sp.]
MKPSLLGRPVVGGLVAVALLAGCGGAQGGAVPQGAAPVEAPARYETAPNVTGTYRGWYVETRNGQTVKGRLRIVIRQKLFKITGPVDIRGHDNPQKTYFVGKVKQSPQGALLRFQVVWLGGYGNSVNMHARVTGVTLEGEGRSQVRTRSEGSRWAFKATKVS